MWQDTFFDSGRKCACHGKRQHYGINWGKVLHRELLPQFFTRILMKFGTDVCTMGVDVQGHIS